MVGPTGHRGVTDGRPLRFPSPGQSYGIVTRSRATGSGGKDSAGASTPLARLPERSSLANYLGEKTKPGPFGPDLVGGFEQHTVGGAKGIRTPDLLDANEARYQLRHSPKVLGQTITGGRPPLIRRGAAHACAHKRRNRRRGHSKVRRATTELGDVALQARHAVGRFRDHRAPPPS